jgi:hypothetical protein
MEYLINKSVRLQNRGFNELDSWSSMLKKAQLKLYNAYKIKDIETADDISKEIDFIQKQVIRLTYIDKDK